MQAATKAWTPRHTGRTLVHLSTSQVTQSPEPKRMCPSSEHRSRGAGGRRSDVWAAPRTSATLSGKPAQAGMPLFNAGTPARFPLCLILKCVGSESLYDSEAFFGFVLCPMPHATDESHRGGEAAWPPRCRGNPVLDPSSPAPVTDVSCSAMERICGFVLATCQMPGVKDDVP